MIPPRASALAATLAVAVAVPLIAQDNKLPRQKAETRFAGPVAGGFLLPNGWTITPAGDQVTLTDLPLHEIPLPDGRHALAATSGYDASNVQRVGCHLELAVVPQPAIARTVGVHLDSEPIGIPQVQRFTHREVRHSRPYAG